MKDIILFRKKFGLPILLLFLIPSIMMLLVVTAWGEETALPPLFSEEDSVLPPFSEENAALRRKTKMTAAGNGAIGRRIGTAPGTVQAMRHLPRGSGAGTGLGPGKGSGGGPRFSGGRTGRKTFFRHSLL